MTKGRHWTEGSTEDFRFRVAFDYVAQLQEVMHSRSMNQRDFAQLLSISEGRVSQVFNNPGNLTLDSMIEWARKLENKLCIVLYNDGDSENRRGPIDSDVFKICWEQLGKPRDHSEVQHCLPGKDYLRGSTTVDWETEEEAAIKLQARPFNPPGWKSVLGGLEGRACNVPVEMLSSAGGKYK